MTYFDDQRIPIPCPKCGHETLKTVAWLNANPNDMIICNQCGADIGRESADLLAGIKAAEKAVDDDLRDLK